MKIKRFVAPDMRNALRMVREEHGPDAVILSNRRTEEGIEIVAASNYDEALVQRALDAVRPEPASAPMPAPTAPVPPQVSYSAANPAPRVPAEAAPNSAMAMMAAITERRLGGQPREQAAPAPAPTATVASRPARPVAPAPAPRVAQAEVESPAVPVRAPAAPRPFAEYMQPVQPQELAAAAPAPAVAAFPRDPVTAPPVAPAVPAPAPIQAAPAVQAEPAIMAAAPVATAAPAPVAAAPVAPLPAAPVFPKPQDDAQLSQLRDELALMRQMIEREMNRLTDERLRGSPVRAQALELMDDYGFDAGLIRDVVMQIPADLELHRGRGLMLGLLSQRLPIAHGDPLEEGGVIALVGPTGAGKTTTIAKLASRFLQTHAARDIALVTTDTIRVGGREQLHSYGRQLGIAVHEADSDASLQQLLVRLADYKLVLIDTAGLGQRDRALAAQLNWLRASRTVRSLLVLPANAHFSDLDEVVRRFAGAAPQGVILTKLDETGRFGSALSVVVDHRLPITWVTDGQHVPDDLHRANAPSLVLRLEDLRRDADKPCIPEQTHAVA
ncbi:flagellar biosynthesis protein FlhF [Pseudoxanthomonas sp. JBR18]|uniref:flagellar biosynthesis protein FlhF n=1 Tax=Pseudoxanthomonas sp. JBR18 TaxID=2969308 RepID=UPI002305063E|nr:flagellar biosynthesis protein FlhF [Pseudoxanthomonas sp. JBR18]WCE03721.1 flagellar biosynthesis protein FlhF [Pseudoxanthomonas sp. JBR18]